jgi:hypothetical protein
MEEVQACIERHFVPPFRSSFVEDDAGRQDSFAPLHSRKFGKDPRPSLRASARRFD